jgi:hypothetical protein
MTDHNYCCEEILGACVGSDPTEDFYDACNTALFRKITTRRNDAKRLGVPLMYTEFGACSNTTSCYREIDNATASFDFGLASWVYW